MKKIIAFILILCTVFMLVSCGHTTKKPYKTKDVAIPEALTTVTAGNDYLPEQRSWEDWLERVADKTTVVLKVKKVSSVSYYWDGKDGVGGITDTTVMFQSLVYGSIEDFDAINLDREFHLIEHFTVDKQGNVLTPKYNLKRTLPYSGEVVDFAINYDERTNPVMEIGKEYIVCIWNGWLMSEYGSRHVLESILDGNTTVVPPELYEDGYLCFDAFEFSEEAYNASCAIVNAYTAKGEGREDNSYNLYHAMVKEAYELFFVK